MHGYPFSFGNSGYMKPLGGRSMALIPGVLAIHSVPFLRVFLEIGGRATAIKLNTPDEGILVFAPVPWGPEAQKFLQTLEPDKTLADINVKYLVAPDVEHHMALKSWKEQFPSLRIIGPDLLNEKKKAEGISMDFAFTEKYASKLLTSETWPSDGTLNLPQEVTDEFDFVYFPKHQNHELVVLHKPTRTLLTADLFFNLPSYDQYEGTNLSPTSGLSFLTKFMGIDSWIMRKTFGQMLPRSDGVALNAIYDWNFQRIIPCHGNVMEGPEVSKKFASLFRMYIKEKV